MKRMITVFLAAALTVLTFCSCGAPVSDDLMRGITANPVSSDSTAAAELGDPAMTDFAVRLLRACMEDGRNTLISPLSVASALSMTANGAAGETLAQMEQVLGMPISHLNEWMHGYLTSQSNEEACKMHLANAIWFTDDARFTVSPEFLQTNADLYGADIYQAPLDAAACREINRWVKDKTDGMIREILDEIPADAVMYLVNALAFDAEWQDIYRKPQVREGIFTTESGESRDVDMMYGEESRYLEDAYATGFIKTYRGGRYAFAALLPKEGITLSEYAASLDGERLYEMLKNPMTATVYTAIPQFETEYNAEMSEILCAMGMPDAFDSAVSDFSRLGHSTDGNLFISRVLHKTFLCVDARGTKAGAATVIEMSDGCAALIEEPKQVYLDRPFLYMLIDCARGVPFFIGTMTDPEA